MSQIKNSCNIDRSNVQTDTVLLKDIDSILYNSAREIMPADSSSERAEKRVRETFPSLSNIQSLPAPLFPPGMDENTIFQHSIHRISSRTSWYYKSLQAGMLRKTPASSFRHCSCYSSSCLPDPTGCRGPEVSPGVFHLYEVWHVHWVWRCVHACWTHTTLLVRSKPASLKN